jgi:signal transduction histidine kinase
MNKPVQLQKRLQLEESATFDRQTIDYIQRAAATGLYTLREVYGALVFGHAFLPQSISFRMGIGFLIALVAGYMARDLTQQRLLVEAALEDVRRVDRIRAGLVSTLAHDVRGPLTAIRTALTTLLKRAGTLSLDVTEELLEGAERQAARMELLATDLLDLARLERGRLELSFQDVVLADAVSRALSYVDRAERVQVRIEPALKVRADPGRLEQIVVNLVSNALRHGEEPFAVEASRTDGRVVLAFTDQGRGIPEEEHATLFDPFRVDENAGSVGFGLAVVRALTEAHGGHVEYRHNQPRGARFEVTIPLAAEPVP